MDNLGQPLRMLQISGTLLSVTHRFTLASSLVDIHNSLLHSWTVNCTKRTLGLTSSWMLLCYRDYAVAVHSMDPVCSLVWVLTSHEGCMSTIVFMSLSSKEMHIYMYLKLKH